VYEQGQWQSSDVIARLSIHPSSKAAPKPKTGESQTVIYRGEVVKGANRNCAGRVTLVQNLLCRAWRHHRNSVRCILLYNPFSNPCDTSWTWRSSSAAIWTRVLLSNSYPSAERRDSNANSDTHLWQRE